MENNNPKFEEKVKELEQIINELETGDIDLEESVNKYTRAMQLVKECDEQLNKIEEKITKIVLENNEIDSFEVEN